MFADSCTDCKPIVADDEKKVLPFLTNNRFAPTGYKAKADSGPCQCKDEGFGLDSCGELCCENSPYTATDPQDPFYYMNGGTRSTKNLCWEADSSISTGSDPVESPKDMHEYKRETPDPKDPIFIRKMASNCSPDYNLKNVTSYNKWKCNYLGKGLDDEGNWVRNPFQEWKGSIASCDHETIRITKDLENDVRKMAYFAAHGDEAKLDMNQLVCTISSVPMQ